MWGETKKTVSPFHIAQYIIDNIHRRSSLDLIVLTCCCTAYLRCYDAGVDQVAFNGECAGCCRVTRADRTVVGKRIMMCRIRKFVADDSRGYQQSCPFFIPLLQNAILSGILIEMHFKYERINL
jgi:hypothetical protein